jgi:hypothetical protein
VRSEDVITGLDFRGFPGAVVMLDRGCSADQSASWLAAAQIHYWGVRAPPFDDDHGYLSSTLAHQSEQVLAAAMIPVINPGSLQEYFDFGLLGFALSCFSGCWVGFKAI